MRIYPNPSPGIFEVISESLDVIKLSVFNNIGELILEESISADVHRVDLSKYDRGMYTVFVSTRSGMTATKLILY